MLTYKNYVGHVKFDDEANIFHGEVINTRDVITFQGYSVEEIRKAFIDSIDDYLSFCKSRGEEAEKPYSGKFNLRLDPELHRQADIAAKIHGMSLNNWIRKVVKKAVNE